MEKQSRNKVSLRLTEPALFLRTHSGRHIVEDSQPTLLRGLLVVDLVKPTRISSIEAELQGKTTTIWPEGFGARRVEVTETHEIFQASVVYFRAGKAPSRRPTSVGPGTQHNSDDDWDEYPHIVSSPSTSRPSTRPSSRQARRRSADGYTNHSTQLYDQYHIPIPPYSPSPGLPGTLSAISSPGSSTAHLPSTTELESLSNRMIYRRSRSTLAESSNPFLQRTCGDMNDQHHDLNQRASSSMRSPFRSVTPTRDRDSLGSHPRPHRSRFSLASMSNALMDAMKLQARGRSLEKGAVNGRDQLSQSRGRTLGNGISDGAPVEPSVGSKDRSALSMISDFLKLDLVLDDHKEYGSNWKEFKKVPWFDYGFLPGTYTYPISIAIPGHCPPTLYCECGQVTWTLKAVVHRPGAFKSKLTATREVTVVACPIDDNTEESENLLVERHWDNQLQYLISVSGTSFCIGGTIPISLTFLPLAKVRIHKIVVSIEGLYGFHSDFNKLDETCQFIERVDYYTKMARLVRSDPITHFVLLSAKGAAKGDDPILPLDSDDVEAFRKSPLYKLVTPDDDPSQMAANLMGPGPWTFRQDLQLPKSCNQMYFSNKNKLSNISITHTLKLVIRVESASDLHLNPKTGKRKMFDIVVQTPVQVLSVSPNNPGLLERDTWRCFIQCRCNPDWRALPGYSEHLSNPQAVMSGCPCEIGRTKWTLFTHPTLERTKSHQSSESSAYSAEASPINLRVMRSLRQDVPTPEEISSQFERLVSGQVAETGETPPAYED
ncbi:hypothetical protein M378DRAFT_196178 [Amanita muscaria Koide BX008]|uniref:Arrestin C-terminal-like domain-containing protein n=1 Tax=Amanita muscaria (strain Koide BX008) TaxID=946122 RepID=A0A0C2SYY8_AMAMK|nr:hypothetical protein M378DRAFT_196178 [Amanita muscaria Koide BX008]